MTAIRCAHCRDRHASVAAVRLCAEREKRIAERYAPVPLVAETQQERVARVAASARYQRKQLEDRIAADRAVTRAAESHADHHCEDFDGECCQTLTVEQMLDITRDARDRA